MNRPATCLTEEPGRVFNYASGNAQLLVHIFNKAVGKDIEENAAQHLFAPLGIDKYYWKRTPAGHADGSGALYLRPHDLAKFGYLYLHKGAWDGKQLVTAERRGGANVAAHSTEPNTGTARKGPDRLLEPIGFNGDRGFRGDRLDAGRERTRRTAARFRGSGGR